MSKTKSFNSACKEDVFESLIGNTITNVQMEIGESKEGIIIETCREIENVTIGQDIFIYEEKYFLSEEYIVNITLDSISHLDYEGEDSESEEGVNYGISGN